MLDVTRLLCGDLSTGEVLRHVRNTATTEAESRGSTTRLNTMGGNDLLIIS